MRWQLHKSGGVIAGFLLVIILVVVALSILGAYLPETPPSNLHRPTSKPPAAPRATYWTAERAGEAQMAMEIAQKKNAEQGDGKDQQLIDAVEELVRTGGIYSIEPAGGTVRVNTAWWVLENVTQKQQITLVCFRYCQLKANAKSLDVLSDRNDQKLATYDSWHGVRILQ